MYNMNPVGLARSSAKKGLSDSGNRVSFISAYSSVFEEKAQKLILRPRC
jgi:hypothetical protein